MDKTDTQAVEIPPAPEKKHNLGAKIGIATTLGLVVGGKISMIGLIPDLNNMFPKGTTFGAKWKTVFSKDVLPLFNEALQAQVKKGHNPFVAYILATRWSGIAFLISGGALGVLGWKGADRIENSSDIWHHPVKSTKLILGLESPETASAKAGDTIEGKHAAAIVAQRAPSADAPLQR